MSELRFTKTHEWLRVEDDGTAVIGITDYAQQQLGDVVYVELPDVGREVAQDEEAAVVESVKAASDVKMPVSGTVVAINSELTAAPERINKEPTGGGWFLRLRPSKPQELQSLMSANQYGEYVAGLG